MRVFVALGFLESSDFSHTQEKSSYLCCSLVCSFFVLTEHVFSVRRVFREPAPSDTVHANVPRFCCLPDVSFLENLYLVLKSIHSGVGLKAVAFQAKGNSSL